MVFAMAASCCVLCSDCLVFAMAGCCHEKTADDCLVVFAIGLKRALIVACFTMRDRLKVL